MSDRELARYETEGLGVAPDVGAVHLIAFYVDSTRLSVPEVCYHSPTGLEYGYLGSGPADMALTILAHYHGIDAALLQTKLRNDGGGNRFSDAELRVINSHQEFKFEHIGPANRKEPLVIHKSTLVNFVASQAGPAGQI